MRILIGWDDCIVPYAKKALDELGIFASKRLRNKWGSVKWDALNRNPKVQEMYGEDIYNSQALVGSVIPDLKCIRIIETLNKYHQVYITTNASTEGYRRRFEVFKEFFPFMDQGQFIHRRLGISLSVDLVLDNDLSSVEGGKGLWFKGAFADECVSQPSVINWTDVGNHIRSNTFVPRLSFPWCKNQMLIQDENPDVYFCRAKSSICYCTQWSYDIHRKHPYSCSYFSALDCSMEKNCVKV